MDNTVVLYISIFCTVAGIICMSVTILSFCCWVATYVNSTRHPNTIDEETEGIRMSECVGSRTTEAHEMSHNQQFNTDQGLVQV